MRINKEMISMSEITNKYDVIELKTDDSGTILAWNRPEQPV